VNAMRTLDQARIDQVGERLFGDVNGAMTVLNVYLGHRLGFFRALAESGPTTPAELAQETGCAERYVREWLECMVVNEYLEHEPGLDRFTLPAEHAAVLADAEGAAFAAPFTCFIPSLAQALPRLIDAFHSGGGVPFEDYGADAREAIGAGNRPMFVNDYVSKWIAAMPDVAARLRAGGHVADIGCGVGWSSISLAVGFPDIRVDAVEPDAASVAEARAHAVAAGVADRVTFHEATAEAAPLRGPYDLVTAFECLHDMAYPVAALRRMRALAGPYGIVLVADEAVADTLEENHTFLGRLNYNFSVLHCLPQAMVYAGAAGTGTVIRPSTLRQYARAAGFTQVDVLPIENPLWRFYRLTP
jgi:2-polyprenyl-3-methyl-5-hydroxy-6-metoxy-1,4-benzoquinol methylase